VTSGVGPSTPQSPPLARSLLRAAFVARASSLGMAHGVTSDGDMEVGVLQIPSSSGSADQLLAPVAAQLSALGSAVDSLSAARSGLL